MTNYITTAPIFNFLPHSEIDDLSRLLQCQINKSQFFMSLKYTSIARWRNDSFII